MSTAIQEFVSGFSGEQNQETLKQYIPDKDIRDRFSRVVKRAVQENPELLQADLKSLYFACEKAAQDGLMPDGREGFLSIYNTNVGSKQSPQWIKKVQWQPMIEGMRKILGENGILLRAEVVYEVDRDNFKYVKGDNPHILHEPDVFATERGEVIGAYAIATDRATGEILGREAMNADELQEVRNASKNPNGTVYQKWPGEMQRKAPARRLFKQIPRIASILKDVLESDNLNYDMNKPPEASNVATQVQDHVRLAASNSEAKLEPASQVIHHSEPEPVEVTPTRVEDEWPADDAPQGEPQEPDF
jgi:recombination protein RecT